MDTQFFNVLSVFAVLPVSDLKVSIEWYTKLFGRAPDNQPAPNVAEYYLAESRDPSAGTLQIMIDTDRAGGGLATINVLSIDQVGEALKAMGMTIETQTFPINAEAGLNVVMGTVVDPDGNGINVIQPPR